MSEATDPESGDSRTEPPVWHRFAVTAVFGGVARRQRFFVLRVSLLASDRDDGAGGGSR